MLSLFPSLFSFEPLAPFLLRLTLAAVFIYWSYTLLRTRGTSAKIALGAVDGIIGFLLVIGLFTQLGALAAAVILVAKLVKKIQAKAFFTDGVNYYFILFIIAVSLLFLGPGAFAFDYPL